MCHWLSIYCSYQNVFALFFGYFQPQNTVKLTELTQEILKVKFKAYSTSVAIIMSGISHQTSHDVLGHYVVPNITKFQTCRPNN